MGERSRRLVHLGGTVVPAAYLVDAVAWSTVRWFMLAVAATAAVAEAVRLGADTGWGPLVPLTRPYEADAVAGYALYAWSVTAVVWAFAPPVALPGVLMLSVGDPVAGALGRLAGDDPAGRATGGRAGAGTGTGGDRGAADALRADASVPDATDVDDGDGGDGATDADATDADDGDARDDRLLAVARTKPPAVLAATFLVCSALAWPFTTATAGAAVGTAAAAAGAAGATLADGVKPAVGGAILDDNLTIPPAACLGIWAVLRAAGAVAVATPALPLPGAI